MNNEKESICPYCGKKFERPHGFKTETEAFHIHGCNLSNIQETTDYDLEDLDEGKKLMFIDELKKISKISSFGATVNPRNKYYNRMMECERLIKKLKNDER